MPKEPTISLANSKDYECGENTGAHGNIYQRDLAFVLFVRGTMRKYKFKLATEMTVAGKFDDVVMYVEDLDETWLFQAKHAQLDGSKPNKISEKELFPSDERLQGKDFDLFKYMQSYFQVEGQMDGRKRYFIFTNKDLEESNNLGKWIRDASGEVDALVDFSDFGGAYKTFELDVNDITRMLPVVNVEFYKVKNAIVNVFKTGNVDKVLLNYKTPLAKILCITSKVLRFTDSFIAGSSGSDRIVELHKLLLDDFKQELSLVEIAENAAIKSLLDKRNSRNQELPVFLDGKMVTAFFKSLTLCVNQPNELRSIVDRDTRVWLRAWVRPDNLGKFSESQLKLPATKFDEVFKSWNEPDMKGPAKSKNKSFLLSDVGINCWDKIIKELDQFTAQPPDVLRRYYVHREVMSAESEYVNKQNSGISDNEFSRQLSISSDKNRCLVLIADPGMGKTTFLQYVSFEAQKLTSKVIFLIYLSSLKDKLLQSNDCQDLTGALDIIGSALSWHSCSMLTDILDGKEGDICFFLDAFDEVPTSEHRKLISVVQHLLKTQRVRIVISGRKHVENDLRQALAAKVMYLEPFRANDQMMFLEKFWNIPCEDPIVSHKFQKYADKLLDRFNANIYNFMKMPLMIRLLAEVYADDLENFLQSKNENDRLEALSTEVISVVSLFEQFVRKSFCMKMFKKFDLDPYSRNDPYDDEMDPLFDRYVFEHELAAIDRFAYIAVMRDALTDHAKVYKNFRKRFEEGKEKTLLINFTEGRINFVHQSFGEYFVARYLYENLKRYQEDLCFILNHPNLFCTYFFLILEENLDQSSEQLSIVSSICASNNVLAFLVCEAFCLGVLKCLSCNHDLSNLCSVYYGSLLHAAAKIGSYEMCLFLLDEIKIRVDDLGGRFGPGDDSGNHMVLFVNQRPALHLAVEFGHEAVARLLLEHSADVNAPDSNLLTPLHVAVQKGHIHMISLLKDYSANLNAQTNDGDTPLHHAINYNHADCARLLIDLGANVNISTKYGITPLALAVEKGFPNIVAQLISNSANVGVQFNTASISGRTLLHLASQRGSLDTVKHIVSLSPSIDIPDGYGYTPLYYAACGGHVEIVKLLIELKANVNALKPNTLSPLHAAAGHGHTAVVKVLIDHKANVHALESTGSTPLHNAARKGRSDIAKLLIDASVDINALNEHNMTALHWAAKKNHSLFLNLLLDHSADPNIANCDGWTPLHCAANQGSSKAVALLVEQPIDINARTSEDQTPLHFAAVSGYRDIVEILISKSADLNAQDKKNRTPLHLAINFGNTHVYDLLITRYSVDAKDLHTCTPLLLAAHTEAPVKYVRLLIENGSNVNATRKDGWTVLHWAAEKGHFDIAELLIERSAHVDAQDGAHRTPLHNAAEFGHTSIVQLLIRHSATVTASNKDKNTPLHLATGKGHMECAKLLIQSTEGTPLHLTNVNAFNKRKWTPLHLAAHQGYPAITQLLIDTVSTVVDARDKNGKTPLHMTALNGHLDVAELLINASANVNVQDNQKWTPLHLAARSGHGELVMLLLRYSADVNVRDRNGKTSLDLATLSRHMAVVDLLKGLAVNLT